MKETKYPKTMLPGVHYEYLNDDFTDQEVDLEFEALQNLRSLTKELTEILMSEKLIQSPELVLAHLCAYLGYLVVSLFGKEQADQLLPSIEILLKDQAYQSYELFMQYPVTENLAKDIKDQRLQALRNTAPGSIIVQTIRLGRIIFDAVDELMVNAPLVRFQKEKQLLFASLETLIPLLNKTCDDVKKEWRNELPFRYIVNQTTIQIAWVMGYFAHLDKKAPDGYLSYGLPCIGSFNDFAHKIILRGYFQSEEAEYNDQG